MSAFFTGSSYVLMKMAHNRDALAETKRSTFLNPLWQLGLFSMVLSGCVYTAALALGS